jgi:2'-5' RNA ligase
MPPHVTILFPFLAEPDLTREVLARLDGHFAVFAPFDYELRQTGAFPGVLYLRPEPEARFSEIIVATLALFPRIEPYGEPGLEPSPHLTVAHADTEEELEEIRTSFEESLARHGTIRGVASEAALMLHSGAAWLPVNAFAFRGRRGGQTGGAG